MKSVSGGLAAHIAQQTTSLATCWLVTLVNAGSPIPTYGFTDHDRDLEIDGVTYEAATGYSPSDVSSNDNLDVDNLDIQGLLSSPSITEDDLRAGLWDYAEFRIFRVNWADLTQGRLRERRGRLGEVRVSRQRFIAELLGMMQAYTTSILEVTSPGCRATLGDARCGVDLSGSPQYTFTGTITGVTSDIILVDSGRAEAAGYFEHGVMTMTSGLAAQRSMEVKEFPGAGVIKLQLPFPYTVQVGDTYTISAGCDKRIETCRDRFDNVVNFRGEPYLAGLDKLVQQGRHNG